MPWVEDVLELLTVKLVTENVQLCKVIVCFFFFFFSCDFDERHLVQERTKENHYWKADR